MGLFSRKDREAFGAATASFSLVALVVAFSALVVAATDDDGGGGGGGGGAPAAAPATGEGVAVALSEFAISPATLSAPVGGTLDVANDGTVAHDLAVEGTDVKTALLNGGDSASLDLGDLDAGEYAVYCTVPSHRDLGMEATLTIGDAAAGGEAAGGGSGAAGGSGGMAGGTSHDPEELRRTNDEADHTQQQPVDAYVAQLEDGPNTRGVGNQPLEPRVLPDGTKQFRIVAEITKWEVEPDRFVDAWTYNGTVPGPMIQVDPGDSVRIVLVNRLPQSTALHFHGLQTPNAVDGVPFVTQQPVKPGKELAYEFVAQGPAVGMYHSHHHAEHQVPDGLLGVFMVGDLPLPEGTGPVAQKVPMVLNDAGVIGYSLNGKSFPATAPVIAEQGDWVLIHYFNEGLQIHPMHLHGLPQLVIAKDGFPLDQPYRADTVNVAPGERYSVLVQATEPGVWAYHCHILNHAERESGMFGMVTTFIVQ